ncbi:MULTISPECIES: hypothetical protein [unclassified Psychrobacillus]|uniref:hypothetical protein n=1 Tax=unclassified Psychrobacillus TaxID=2636677 RepID=UPI0012493B7E|nr:hypothetical protein [Psychrobacillus sp. AK 1817]QEY19934.1 hypothetical protein D0S48_04055 [Psychrobacillus sp. AK 1817]
MDANELINVINHSIEKLDYASARKYIEENLNLVNINKHLLIDNARSVLVYINDTLESGAQPLTRQEVSLIYTINKHATKFDVRALRMIIRDNPSLLIRQDIKHYFNEDAKTLLEGMNVIPKQSKQAII